MDMGWLQNIFAFGGSDIRTELKNRMESQAGLDGARYIPPKTATQVAKARAGFGSVAAKRMIRTRDFQNNAFLFTALPDRLVVYINPALHGRELRTARKAETKAKLTAKKMGKGPASAETYQNIARWQLQTGMAEFFPQDENEIRNLVSVQKMLRTMSKEFIRQARMQTTVHLKQELKLG